MVSREHLKQHGLRAYEGGRWRSAARIVLLLVPLAALCLLERRGRMACFCSSIALFGLAIWLRWRNRDGVDAVSLGLQAGSMPLLLGLALGGSGAGCGLTATSPLCIGFALLVGGTAGVWIGVGERQLDGQPWSSIAAGAVAALAASLGCLRLGVVGLAPVFSGIALGIATLSLVRSERAGQ